jgi:hypothetical protein
VEGLRKFVGKLRESPVVKWYFTNMKQENYLSLHHEAGKKERKKEGEWLLFPSNLPSYEGV